MEQPVRKILRIDASARQKNSYSRAITNMLINKLNEAWPEAVVVERDIYKDSHFLSEAMVEGMASSANTQKDDFLLPVSDLLIQELLSTDILVLAVPMYNFTIPAALKAYIDLVVRAGKTFRFGSNGAQGLIEDMKVWIVVTSNGTALRSAGDFVSGYLEFVLRFIGVRDIQFVDGTQLMLKGVDKVMQEVTQSMDERSANSGFAA